MTLEFYIQPYSQKYKDEEESIHNKLFLKKIF